MTIPFGGSGKSADSRDGAADNQREIGQYQQFPASTRISLLETCL
jgi:hypothetical protein